MHFFCHVSKRSDPFMAHSGTCHYVPTDNEYSKTRICRNRILKLHEILMGLSNVYASSVVNLIRLRWVQAKFFAFYFVLMCFWNA